MGHANLPGYFNKKKIVILEFDLKITQTNLSKFQLVI